MCEVFQDGGDQLRYFLLEKVRELRTWDPHYDAQPLIEAEARAGHLKKGTKGYSLTPKGEAWLKKARATLTAEARRAPRAASPRPPAPALGPRGRARSRAKGGGGVGR
jgi:hypothetical protein